LPQSASTCSSSHRGRPYVHLRPVRRGLLHLVFSRACVACVHFLEAPLSLQLRNGTVMRPSAPIFRYSAGILRDANCKISNGDIRYPRKRGNRMIAGRAREACWRSLGLKAALLVALLMAWHQRASTEEATKVVRVGVLASAQQHPIQSFKERLTELGWIEGKNVRFDYRWAEADDTPNRRWRLSWSHCRLT